MRKINHAGLELIKLFEGVILVAYRDAVGIPTIGYGHTKGVKLGQKITAAQAEALLAEDLHIFEDGVEPALGAAETTDNQFAAMVSLAFNIGLTGFKQSSVRWYHALGNREMAQKKFALWNKAGGKVLAGLTRRRAAEAALYGTK
jgi:lysozyme